MFKWIRHIDFNAHKVIVFLKFIGKSKSIPISLFHPTILVE